MTLRALGASLGCLLGVACAAPEPPLSPARQALVEHAPAGPILAEVHGPTFGLDEARRDALVTEALADGIAAVRASFTTDPGRAATADLRLVALLNPTGDPPASVACRGPDSIATAPVGRELAVLAVFCREDEPLGVVREQGPVTDLETRAARRLLWRTAARLFPDDYPARYGFNLIPGIAIGVGGTFGF